MSKPVWKHYGVVDLRGFIRYYKSDIRSAEKLIRFNLGRIAEAQKELRRRGRKI